MGDLKVRGGAKGQGADPGNPHTVATQVGRGISPVPHKRTKARATAPIIHQSRVIQPSFVPSRPGVPDIWHRVN